MGRYAGSAVDVPRRRRCNRLFRTRRMTAPHADLVRMINQIADFFDAYPEQEAVSGVTEHLHKFWDPSMRRALIQARESLNARLHPIARLALARLAEATP